MRFYTGLRNAAIPPEAVPILGIPCSTGLSTAGTRLAARYERAGQSTEDPNEPERDAIAQTDRRRGTTLEGRVEEDRRAARQGARPGARAQLSSQRSPSRDAGSEVGAQLDVRR